MLIFYASGNWTVSKDEYGLQSVTVREAVTRGKKPLQQLLLQELLQSTRGDRQQNCSMSIRSKIKTHNVKYTVSTEWGLSCDFFCGAITLPFPPLADIRYPFLFVEKKRSRGCYHPRRARLLHRDAFLE